MSKKQVCGEIIIDGTAYRPVGDSTGAAPAADKVLVRTYTAGVHYGVLVFRVGTEGVLKNARRIWSWDGANTLHEVALRGVATSSRISEAVPEITLTEIIEVIPLTAEALAVLDGITWRTKK